MSRQSRLDAPGALHHVMGRGIEGIKIFNNKKDRENFLERLAGLYGADVARFLGINTSAVNRLAVSDELPELEKYL